MGHRYSTVYTHNTEANYQEYKQEYPKASFDIFRKLGSQKCVLFNSYPGNQRCKICIKRMDKQQVIMFYCKLRHRYHVECYEKYAHDECDDRKERIIKCQECRNMLNNHKDCDDCDDHDCQE